MTSSTTRRPPVWYPARASPWQQFRRSPAEFLARWLYKRRGRRPAPPVRASSGPPVTIVCISDTHNARPDVPDGDVLLHAGDLTDRGTFEELQAQLDWLKGLPHRHKVVIGGNHDVLLDPAYVARFPDRIYEGDGTARADLDWGDLVYLDDSTARLDGLPGGRSLVVYGFPWTEELGTWAFQYPPVRRVWPGRIPPGTDVLLTHGPPRGHLDQGGKGCPQLLREIWRARPRLVVFGHVHDGHGREELTYDTAQAAYDGVLAGDRGLAAVVVMACWLLRDWLWGALRLPRWLHGREQSACLVNAAVSPGRAGGGQHPAIVVEL